MAIIKRIFDGRKKKGLYLQKRINIGWLSLLLLVVFMSADHPYHVSFAELNYDSEAKSMEVSVKIFSDDLQMAVNRLGNRRIKLGAEPDSLAVAEVWRYVQKHFMLKQSEEANFPVELLGIESFPDNTWVYFYFRKVEASAPLVMQNTLLFNLLGDQENRVTVIFDGKKQFLQFTPQQPAQSLVLKNTENQK